MTLTAGRKILTLGVLAVFAALAAIFQVQEPSSVLGAATFAPAATIKKEKVFTLTSVPTTLGTADSVDDVPFVFTPPQNCNDGVHRRRNASVRRFLTTAKVHRKYGLTNVLLIATSMFAYAAIDDRAVTFPRKSPVVMERLIDLQRTEQCLSMANVMLQPRDAVDALQLKQVSAWRLGLHLGSRALAGSVQEANATALLGKHRMNMGLTSHIPIVSYGDFFLRFPFYATKPLDECFYMSRIVFGGMIEEAAHNQLAALRGKGARRFLALHLRLEEDSLKLDRRLRLVKPEEVARFWAASVQPLVERHSLDAVYVCSGALAEGYFDAITATSRVPVFWRTTRRATAQSSTTSHEDAAVDLLIAQAATVAMSTERSTFLLAIWSRRCSMTPAHTTATERFRNSSLFSWESNYTSSLNSTAATSGVQGIYNYRLDWSVGGATTLSDVEHIPCGRPWQGHCFYGTEVV